MLDDLFLEVLNLTITGSFVILGVIVARLLMVKFPKKYSYLLWAIVLLWWTDTGWQVASYTS